MDRPDFFWSATVDMVRECLEADAEPRDSDYYYPVIFSAAFAARDPGIISLLTAAGADPDVRVSGFRWSIGRPGYTSLHTAAAQNPTPGIVDALVEAGADINARANDGATPLHAAWRNSNLEVFRALLRLGADPLARDERGRIADPSSCANWNTAGFVRLASPADFEGCQRLGEDVNTRDSDGNSPLHWAAATEHPPAVTTLLEAGADINGQNNLGATPLHAAANNQGTAVITLLLAAGAELNAGAGAFGTPLLSAISNRTGVSSSYRTSEMSEPALNALLEAGADLNAADAAGTTPLMASLEPRHRQGTLADLPMRLLDLGANANARNADGDTPLHLSVGHRDSTLVSTLVQAGTDVNARNSRGRTPLHMARAQNNLPAVRILLNSGADPDARDNAGQVADPDCYWGPESIVSIAKSPAESVRGCLESGIPVDARDEEGATYLARMVSARGCCDDFENVLSAFVAAGADVNARDNAGRTALHRAAGSGIPAWLLPTVMSALLDTGANPDARDSQGSTPLHVVAGKQGSSRLISLLAAAGADVNVRNDAGETPLRIAQRHSTTTSQTLMQLGADPAAAGGAGDLPDPVACDRWGTQSFFALAGTDIVADCIAGGADVVSVTGRGGLTNPVLAVASGSTRDDAVVRLLLQAGADPAARDYYWEFTPLHHAARSGTPGVVQALLEAGADPDAWATGFDVDWGWGWTPLHLAARSNPDPDIVRVLVEAGADLHAPGGESFRTGNTPLHYAGENSNPAVAAALLESGADINALSETGRTPLHEIAANASNPAVIELLIAAGADVNAHDGTGYTPLHSAAWYNPHPEVMAALIAAGGDVNARDPDGYVPSGRRANDQTPLFRALYRGGFTVSGQPWPTGHNVPVVDVLLRAGSDLAQTDGSGQTALHAAARWLPAAVPLLLRFGADPNARDAEGKTPMDYALENRSLQGLPEVLRMREAMRRDAGR